MSKHHPNHMVQVVKANRWVQLGHTLLTLFFVPEVPLDEQVLSFGVAIDSFTVASKLGVVRWQEPKSRVDAVDEGLDLLLVTEDHATLPVRRDGAEVDDLDVADRVDDFGDLRRWDLAHGAPLGGDYGENPFYRPA
jgi:hypothetical protein